ncbi:MAG: aminoacyl--tRNA ligase-related protein [Candidatus Shikimatogenerans sp. Tduv]|uniref:threonine--tRNA ligase n=1 Tax=Candidatus Shikimatogenerans sp. Tduv TaxID=3158567 RepID=A0AAU7QRE5_9FLAO
MYNNFNKINKILNLFILSNNLGKGLIIWLHNGLIIKSKIKNILLNLYKKKDFFLIKTPHIGLKEIYIISGHYLKYKNNFFSFNNKSNYNLKPMNCPYHCYIINILKPSKIPFRIMEFSNVYRNEKSGELKNIFRSRNFIQDDCHIFCNKKHIYEEINQIYKHIIYIYNIFNFKKYKIFLSIKSDNNKSNKFIKNSYWEKSQLFLFNFLKKKKCKFKIVKGEAAFYGPKIDFMVKDSLGKYWQLSTIQLDYNLPINFNIKYKKKIIIIHRAILGSFERFIGLLLDNNRGNLPIWLSLIHLSILPINIKFYKYSLFIKKTIEKKIKINIKIFNNFNKNFNYYIKKSELNKIPFLMLIGEKEYKNHYFSLRYKKKKKILYFKNIYKLIFFLKKKIAFPKYYKYYNDKKN